MPEQITKWRTNDGYEYDTEKQAILHEQCKTKIKDLTVALVNGTNLYTEDAEEVAEFILERYTLEKR